MTKYESKLTGIPTEIRRFIDAFQGQGNLRVDKGELVFEFEADDLWDSREVIETVMDDLTGYFQRGDIEFARPVERDANQATDPDEGKRYRVLYLQGSAVGEKQADAEWVPCNARDPRYTSEDADQVIRVEQRRYPLGKFRKVEAD